MKSVQGSTGSTRGWPMALFEVVMTPIFAFFQASLGGVSWDPDFEWKLVRYTPLLVCGVLILLWICGHLSVKKWFTAPIKQVETPAGNEVSAD